MSQTQANIDFCGIKNLLNLLNQEGFEEKELKRILSRISAQSGADIIMADKQFAA